MTNTSHVLFLIFFQRKDKGFLKVAVLEKLRVKDDSQSTIFINP